MSSEISNAPAPALLTTREFANYQRCQPETIRRNVCDKGHHHGVRPIKAQNGRLFWRAEDLARLMAQPEQVAA